MRTIIRLLFRGLPYVLWWLPLGLSAQVLTNSSAVITVTTGANMRLNGDLLNTGTGLLENNGTITLSGDLIHNASNTAFGNSAGAVVLDGDVQAITGSQVAVFNDLTLTGTGNKSLQQNVQVGGAYASHAGILDVRDRVLLLNGHELTVLNPAPSAVTYNTGYKSPSRLSLH